MARNNVVPERGQPTTNGKIVGFALDGGEGSFTPGAAALGAADGATLA
jgi:hypothetical protein